MSHGSNAPPGSPAPPWMPTYCPYPTFPGGQPPWSPASPWMPTYCPYPTFPGWAPPYQPRSFQLPTEARSNSSTNANRPSSSRSGQAFNPLTPQPYSHGQFYMYTGASSHLSADAEKQMGTNLKVAISEPNKSVSLNKNFVCSPLGIEFFLSILANGSSGKTQSQIYEFLGIKNLEGINQKASEVMEVVSLNTDTNSEGSPIVSFVNGAWVDNKTCLKPAFQKLLEITYKADARALDFQNKAEVCKEVNSWVTEATRGVIRQILSPQNITQDTILTLDNALYFKAAWKTPYRECVQKKFHLLNGETIQAPFMTPDRLQAPFTGACFDDFRLVKFPYKTGQDNTREFAMYIFLPNANDGLPALLAKFKDSEFLNQKFDLPIANLTDLWIPKFKFEHMFSVKDTFERLGLDRMFKKVGELGEIVEGTFSEELYVSDIYQKSVVEVNEEGTVAASVLAFLCGASYPPPNQFSFVADHPFMFMIREEVLQVTLFVGTVVNPLME